MRPLTIISDWHQNDYYLGMLKGRLTGLCPDFNIIDLAHNVPQFSIDRAAFILRNCYSSFPDEAIHLVMVNSDANSSSQFLIVEQNSHTFILPDNGIIGLLFNTIPDKVYSVKFESTGSFSSLEGIVSIAQNLYKKHPINEFANPVNTFDTKTLLNATWEESLIIGNIVYIDSYYNAISNISQDLFDRIGQGRPFDIYVQSYHNRVNVISTNYNQVASGELLALFNSADLLEIAIRNGFASQLMNLSIGSEVKIKFLPFQQDILIL
jgi:hypothetical protein